MIPGGGIDGKKRGSTLQRRETTEDVDRVEWMNTDEALEMIARCDLGRILEVLESGIDLRLVRREVWRETMKLLNSHDETQMRGALDIIAYVAMADDDVLKSLMYLHVHQMLFNIVSSERTVDLVITCIELLTEMISDKPLVCQALDGYGFIEAPLFTLQKCFHEPGCYCSDADDDVAIRQLTNTSFVLLSSALSVFSVCDDKLCTVRDLVDEALCMSPATSAAAVRAVYTVSFCQPEVAMRMFSDSCEAFARFCLQSQNASLTEYALGFLSNLCNSDSATAASICCSEMFLSLEPGAWWNERCHANYLTLLTNIVRVSLNDSGEPSSPLIQIRLKCKHIRDYCLTVMRECPFKDKVKACDVVCRLIETEDSEILSVLFPDQSVLDEMLSLLESHDQTTIEICAGAILILLGRSPLGGMIDVAEIIRYHPISSSIHEASNISRKAALALQAIDSLLNA